MSINMLDLDRCCMNAINILELEVVVYEILLKGTILPSWQRLSLDQ